MAIRQLILVRPRQSGAVPTNSRSDGQGPEFGGPFLRGRHLRSIGSHGPQGSGALVLTMDVPAKELLAMPLVSEFMTDSIAKSFGELSPLIVRMICSGERAVAEQVAILAGLALLYGHDAERLVRTALAQGEPQRLGIAKVAVSNIGTRRCREWC